MKEKDLQVVINEYYEAECAKEPEAETETMKIARKDMAAFQSSKRTNQPRKNSSTTDRA